MSFPFSLWAHSSIRKSRSSWNLLASLRATSWGERISSSGEFAFAPGGWFPLPLVSRSHSEDASFSATLLGLLSAADSAVGQSFLLE